KKSSSNDGSNGKIATKRRTLTRTRTLTMAPTAKSYLKETHPITPVTTAPTTKSQLKEEKH
ncbi:9570_t:CDS:1, partial [Gigaspora rosea]